MMSNSDRIRDIFAPFDGVFFFHTFGWECLDKFSVTLKLLCILHIRSGFALFEILSAAFVFAMNFR